MTHKTLSSLLLAAAFFLVLALPVAAASPEPAPSSAPEPSPTSGFLDTGDPRSNGQGPGLVGSPFVVALPTDAFELQIATRSSVPYAGTMATIEYATVNAAGETVTVRAEGARMVVRRAAAGQSLLVAGATRRVETAKAVASR